MTEPEITPDDRIVALGHTVKQLEETSKMLVRRDLDLRLAYNELKVLDQQKSEFVSIAAHQLRTPLTSVRFALQMLQDSLSNVLDDGQKHILTLAVASTKHMFDLIEELLMVDALEYGKLALTKEDIDVTNLLHEVSDSNQQLASAKNITLTLSVEPELCFNGDRQRLYDVFLNLIDNAIKYTPEGGAVTVTGSKTDNGLQIQISDTGIGIPEVDITKMFRKFSRAENAQLVDPNGSGLGLYVCLKIVEQHGGTVTFKPAIPQGTCFVVELPYNLTK